MPRFVVLAHDWPEPHLDLFLDAGGSLRAWKLPANFSPYTAATILPNTSHRRFYLDFEGELTGERGSVLRWDHGEYQWIEESAELIRANFAGQRLSGVHEWISTASSNWIFQKAANKDLASGTA